MLIAKSPKAILFDLDGVLIDTEPLILQALKKTTKKYNIYLNNEQLERLKGRRKIDCAKQIYYWTKNREFHDDLLDPKRNFLNVDFKMAKPFVGAIKLIKFCRKINLPIALVTSCGTEIFNLKKSANPFLDLFLTKILGDNKLIKEGKPAPDPYFIAAKTLGVDTNQAWVVEDSYAGALSGLRAGCPLLFFSKDISQFNKLVAEFGNKKIIRLLNLNEIINFLKAEL